MFRLFRRRAVRARRVGGPVGLERIAQGLMQAEALGRLPEDVAAGGPQKEPEPEYIEEAGTPTEDMWAREQERYRGKNEGQGGT